MGIKQPDMNTAVYVEKITSLFGKLLSEMEVGSASETSGVTHSQMQGLSYLLSHGRSSVGDIAQGLCISHPASVRMIERLTKKGLVNRVESETDRRVSIIDLTKEGTELAERILAARMQILSDALAKLDESRIQDLLRGLDALLTAALEDRESVKSVCLHCGNGHIGCCVVNRAHLEQTGTTIEHT